jgi:ribulose-phosphate 3-epimerase
MGATAAVALNPHTPASTVENILDLVDMVLVMTVNPGFGGQSYIKTMEPKIRQVRDMIAARGLSDSLALRKREQMFSSLAVRSTKTLKVLVTQ